MTRRQKESEESEKRLPALSRRELEVFISLSQGKLIEEVAKDFGLRPAPICSHIRSLLKKTGSRRHGDLLAKGPPAGVIQA